MTSPLHDARTAADDFSRLSRLHGEDPGFFTLAVHSFVEARVRKSFGPFDEDTDTFRHIMNAFCDDCRAKAGGRFIPGLDVIHKMISQHWLTNNVRHSFSQVMEEEALAALHQLKRFCELTGLAGGDEYHRLMGLLARWDALPSREELDRQLRELGYRFELEKKSAGERAARLEEYRKREEEGSSLRAEFDALSARLELVERSAGKKDEKIQALRSERHTLETARAQLERDLALQREKEASFDDVREYLERQSRLMVFTRTRGDYERSLMRLTPEQQRVLERISLDRDILVKGAAGTGKTLVLLKAMEKAMERREGEGAASIVLLTYTNTLVKYDAFLSSILFGKDPSDWMGTVDRFLQERFAAVLGLGIDPRGPQPGEPEIEDPSRVAFCFDSAWLEKRVESILEEDSKASLDDSALAEAGAPGFAREGNVAPLAAASIARELENCVWANFLSRQEYVDGRGMRRGMKIALERSQRERVWELGEKLMARMDETRDYSRAALHRRLVSLLEEGSAPGDTLAGAYDWIFVDEVQDLPPVTLRALKLLSKSCLVLAGDADQAIYRRSLSFARSGIEIVGRTSILRTNFRNPAPVHELAERFRARFEGLDSESLPMALRPGPAPELFRVENLAQRKELLLQRLRFFMDKLGYEPENICILAPGKNEIAALAALLSQAGYHTENIRDESFSFSSQGRVRLCTIHSAKGLDFPVVFLWLPWVPKAPDWVNGPEGERIVANILYVAMTRAMDQLEVFLPGSLRDPVMATLVECFEADSIPG